MKNWNKKFTIGLVLAVILALGVVMLAMADDLANSLDATVDNNKESAVITAGGSVEIGFFILPTTGSQDVPNCNVSEDHPATLTIYPPAGVTVSNPVEFTDCNQSKNVTFSSNVPDTYNINSPDFVMAGGFTGSKWSFQNAQFSLTVNQAIDTTAPIVNCIVPDQLLWHGSNVSVDCNASDSSGLSNSADASFSLTTLVTAGTETSSAQTDSRNVCDTKNNCILVGPYTFKVDKKVPVVTCSAADSVWHNDNQSVTCIAIDSGSGLAVAADANFSLSTSVGANEETANAATSSKTVSDAVGNSATAGPYTFKIDKMAPFVTCGTADTDWHATDQSVSCTATDGGSGPTSQTVTLSTNVFTDTETDNGFTNSQSVSDAVGNSSTAGPVGPFKIDKKSPQLYSCDAPDGLWHSSDVTLYCTYTDGGSGPATQDVALSTNVEAGVETNNAFASASGAKACDAVNNCATSPADISGNSIDMKAPTNISFNGSIVDGGIHYFGFVPAAPTCSAVDGGSGLASCVVTGYSAAVGPHTLTATAKDNVGNESTAQLSYEVKAWTLNGFYQPVDMNGVWNTVKNGSTVPLKFEVFAGPTELTDTAVISTLAKQVTCNASSEDTIEVLSSGGTSLRYDTVGGQFIYNWQTPKLPGKCYSVTMTTLDGSSLTAFFKLK